MLPNRPGAARLTKAFGRVICPGLTWVIDTGGLKMPLSIHLAPRRLASVSFLCLGLALAGCAGDEDVAATGSPFSQALFKDYTDLATQAASAPAPQAQDTGFFSDIFGMFGGRPSNPADAAVDAFHAKADQAAKGNEPAPEPAPADPKKSFKSGLAVMNRMVPVMELDPKVVPWGPLSTSTRSMSNSMMSGA